MAIPRGIRNHNPLNIRRSKDQWKGMAEVQSDRAFVQFKSLEYGWRAAFYLLTRTYYHNVRCKKTGPTIWLAQFFFVPSQRDS